MYGMRGPAMPERGRRVRIHGPAGAREEHRRIKQCGVARLGATHVDKRIGEGEDAGSIADVTEVAPGPPANGAAPARRVRRRQVVTIVAVGAGDPLSRALRLVASPRL